MSPVDILILAAGASSRFGGCKLVAPWRGTPLITYALTAAHSVFESAPELVASVNLVLGAHAAAIQTVVAPRFPRVNIYHCDSWSQGLGHSLAYGVAQLEAKNAVLVMLADQPLIDADEIQRLLTMARQNPARIVCAQFSSTLGVPALFPAAEKAALRTLQGDKGAKSLLLGAEPPVVLLPMPHAALDIDSAADLSQQSGSLHEP